MYADANAKGDFERSMKKVALYMRLSKPDKEIERQLNQEQDKALTSFTLEYKNPAYSQSIQNQQLLLKQAVKRDKEYFSYDTIEFIDDGYTGMDENRPSLIRMLSMIESGEIAAVLVKDFSRLSRNALFLARFREQICPLHRVMLISLGDSYDSRKPELGETGIRLRSLFYEYYAKDVSQKVKKALAAKKELGEYAVAKPPFGYRAICSEQWRIHEEEAACVKRIYEGVLRGMSQKEIAIQEEKRIQICGSFENDNPEGQDDKGKSYRMYPAKVHRILHNPVYCGYHVWHKNEMSDFARKKNIQLPASRWRIEKGRHPVIITEEMYCRVQELIERAK